MRLPRLQLIAVLAAVAALSATSAAHHSNVTFYDFDKSFEVSGITVNVHMVLIEGSALGSPIYQRDSD